MAKIPRCRVFMREILEQFKKDGDLLKLIKTVVNETRGYQTDTQMAILMREIDNTFEEILGKCPKCQKPLEVVALARDYVIRGCPEHREFDKVHNL